MKLAEGAINRVINRPFLLIFSALVSLVYTTIDILNPIMAVIFGFSAIGQGDVLGTIISLLQTVLSPYLLIKAVIWVTLGIVLIAFFVSIFFSGYFYIMNNTIECIEKKEREFITGIKMYFKRLFGINLTVFSLMVTFALVMSVIIVPALFTTWSWRVGRSELMGMAVLLDIITAVVVFFAFMFFELYTIYWYPSLYSFKGNSFSKGKSVIDYRFWVLFSRWIVIDLVFIIFELLLLFFRYRLSLSGYESSIFTAVLFAGKFTFTTAFFTWVSTFAFASFKAVKES